MKQICDIDSCTACGACFNICPKKCIKSLLRPDGSLYFAIDDKECVNCHKCEKVCPNKNINDKVFPQKVFAAWSMNEQTHKRSASGGIAAELYQYALSNGFYVVGVFMDENFEAHYKVTNSSDDILLFQNSKYTFSFMDSVYKEIVCLLQKGEKILFIGLPCHVAALKRYVSQFSQRGELYTVDLICHGTPPHTYLQEHIKQIAKKKKKEAKNIYFRDPLYKTEKFAFTVYDDKKNKPFYFKYSQDDDLYQIGYHKGIIYRENCYHCQFAKPERVSDLTLGDFHGLGKVTKYDYERKEVSCLLVNSVQGAELLDLLVKSNRVITHERPLEEPLTYEKQLKSPTIAPSERKQFLDYYSQSNSFEMSAAKAFKKIAAKNRIRKALFIKEIKMLVYKAVPRNIKEKIKEKKRSRK